MGQLEKYGLYVMCLVIFLILGVTLWGEPATARQPGAREDAAVHASVGGPAAAPQRGPTLEDLLSSSPERPAAVEVRRSTELESLLEGDDVRGGSSQPVEDFVEPSVKPVKVAATKPAEQPIKTLRTYTVKKGDILGTIAKRELGATKHWALIAAANPGVDPDRLPEGQKLRIPDVGSPSRPFQSRNKAVATGAYRTYKIRKGDSYSRISKKFFGTEKRAAEIKRMNPDVPERRMKIGKEIKVPRK